MTLKYSCLLATIIGLQNQAVFLYKHRSESFTDVDEIRQTNISEFRARLIMVNLPIKYWRLQRDHYWRSRVSLGIILLEEEGIGVT